MWVILAALIVVTGGKTFLNWLLLMIAGEPFDTAVQSSLFLSPVGEFSFVIAGAGLAAGALSASGYKVIAMSLLATPIWFLMARLMHKVVLGQARILGIDLAGLRLWGRNQPQLQAAAAGAEKEWDPGQSGL